MAHALQPLARHITIPHKTELQIHRMLDNCVDVQVCVCANEYNVADG